MLATIIFVVSLTWLLIFLFYKIHLVIEVEVKALVVATRIACGSVESVAEDITAGITAFLFRAMIG